MQFNPAAIHVRHHRHRPLRPSPVAESELVTMRDVMVNRGPEHGGQWLGGHAALGHRRLRIIDLSPLGNQPMTNEDGTVWLTFNGEVYNFQPLRQELEAKGHKFRSHSDTEVIVHGYEEWGEGVVARMDGMFAIGIWDTRKETLLLAVDRFGKNRSSTRTTARPCGSPPTANRFGHCPARRSR
ncbi:MAG: asparagine synthetase B family protein [Limisphaerales bacterium]